MNGTAALPATRAAPPTEPTPRRWTREEFYRLLDLGFFEGQRVELIDAEVVVTTPQTNWHAAAIARTQVALQLAFGPDYWVRNQSSLDLTPTTVVDPDLAVIRGSPLNPPRDNPTSALLIVEVSQTTLNFDPGCKASLYASAGIGDYWVLDLEARRLVVHRDPIADASQPFGWRYAGLNTLAPGEAVTPLAAPAARVAVADLLP